MQGIQPHFQLRAGNEIVVSKYSNLYTTTLPPSGIRYEM
jgi:uncharacterized membrane protein